MARPFPLNLHRRIKSLCGSETELAAPTPDHYLPLLYIAGTCTPSEAVRFPAEERIRSFGFDTCSASELRKTGRARHLVRKKDKVVVLNVFNLIQRRADFLIPAPSRQSGTFV